MLLIRKDFLQQAQVGKIEYSGHLAYFMRQASTMQKYAFKGFEVLTRSYFSYHKVESAN